MSVSFVVLSDTFFFMLYVGQDEAELLHLLCDIKHMLYSRLKIKNISLLWFYLKSNLIIYLNGIKKNVYFTILLYRHVRILKFS
jgi:hypothetical protein